MNDRAVTKSELRADLKTSMLAQDKVRTRTLRAILTAVTEAEVSGTQAVELDQTQVRDVIVREAGGKFTGLDGRPGPLGSNALATNGKLHDAAMAFLGHFPDESDGGPTAPADGNVRDLASRRRSSD